MNFKKIIFSSLSCIAATTPIATVIACNKEIKVSDKEAYKGKTLSDDFKIPKGTKIIGESAFQDAKLPDNFSIPEGVTTINKYAFQDAKLPDNFSIPEGVTTIKKDAFFGVTFPKSFQLPKSITSIEEGAFAFATFQTTFAWPENIKKLPNYVFSGAIFTRADDPTYYKNEPGVYIPNGITDFGEESFAGVKFPAGFSVPSTLKFVGSGAFQESDFTNVSPEFDFPPNMHYGPVVYQGSDAQYGIFQDSKFNKNFKGAKNAFLRGKPIFDGPGPELNRDGEPSKHFEYQWLFYGYHKRD